MWRTNLTRRGVLSGVSLGAVAGSVALPLWGDRGQGRLGQQQSGLTVRIDEWDESVRAGEHVGVTSTVENGGDSSVEATADLVVGHDPERMSRVTRSLEPGESWTLTQGFDTFPVLQDEEFPVRVEVDGDADERTVSVTGASAVGDATPDGDAAVSSGTEVLFEVGAVEPGESQRTVWWVDGEQVGDSMGPWPATYYAEADAHYWRERFEESGTTHVAAAVLPRDGSETYAAHWEIEVSEGGSASPTIDAARPEERTVVADRDGSLEFELEAADSTGNLDRVVWWLTQADVILDVTELEGERDTATLSLDGDSICHTCHVVPWVCCEDGRFATPADAWELQDAELVDEEPEDSDDESENSDDEPGDSDEDEDETGDSDEDDETDDSNDETDDSGGESEDSDDESGDADGEPGNSDDESESSDDESDDSIGTVSCG